MSYPITGCLVAKAMKNVAGARTKLQWAIDQNKKHGGFSIWPCECLPRCDDDILEKDLARLTMELIVAVPDFAIVLQ